MPLLGGSGWPATEAGAPLRIPDPRGPAGKDSGRGAIFILLDSPGGEPARCRSRSSTPSRSAHRTRTYTPRLQRPGCCHYTRADYAKAVSLWHESQFCHTALPPGGDPEPARAATPLLDDLGHDGAVSNSTGGPGGAEGRRARPLRPAGYVPRTRMTRTQRRDQLIGIGRGCSPSGDWMGPRSRRSLLPRASLNR